MNTDLEDIQSLRLLVLNLKKLIADNRTGSLLFLFLIVCLICFSQNPVCVLFIQLTLVVCSVFGLFSVCFSLCLFIYFNLLIRSLSDLNHMPRKF